jgi:hypothetical protein
MQVKDYFSEIQNRLRNSAFIENVDVEYKVEAGLESHGWKRKKGIITSMKWFKDINNRQIRLTHERQEHFETEHPEMSRQTE